MSTEREIKKRYYNVVSRFCKEQFYMNTYVNITDNTHMEVENCRKIAEYSDVFIRLSTSSGILDIWGQNLKISDYNTNVLVIDGEISSVEFE